MQRSLGRFGLCHLLPSLLCPVARCPLSRQLLEPGDNPVSEGGHTPEQSAAKQDALKP